MTKKTQTVTTKKTVTLDEETHQQLKAIAERRGVTVSVLVQEGVGAVVDLAEKQQDMIEAYNKKGKP